MFATEMNVKDEWCTKRMGRVHASLGIHRAAHVLKGTTFVTNAELTMMNENKFCMIAFIALILCLFSLQGCIVKSEGERIGTISKFSEKGVFVSTWEGEAILGGTGASGNRDNVWYFTVEDSRLVEKIRTFYKTGKVVVLKYRNEMFVAGWRADTNYFVTDVEFASNQ